MLSSSKIPLQCSKISELWKIKFLTIYFPRGIFQDGFAIHKNLYNFRQGVKKDEEEILSYICSGINGCLYARLQEENSERTGNHARS